MTQPAWSTGDDLATVLSRVEGEGRALAAVEQALSDAVEEFASPQRRLSEGQPRGPLEGVPFAVKANIDIAGIVTTSGLDPIDQEPASEDAHAVALLRTAGAIPVATATMAPMAIGAVTEHPQLGACRNPRDRQRHAGGSSGGSGALVGAGIVPFALGSDTMGSVRIPAAYCGTYAWLPTHGAVSPRGLVPLAEPLDSLGVLAADPHLLFEIARVLIAPDPSEPWWHATNPQSHPTRSPRVKVCDVSEPCDRIGIDAVESITRRLVMLGAQDTGRVNFEQLGFEPDALRRRGLMLVEAAAAERFSAEIDAGVVPESVRPLIEFGQRVTGPRLWRAVRELVADRRRIRNALADVDILVLPTTPAPAPPLGEDPAHAADFTAWVNVAGLPVVVVPWGPASVQLVGRPGEDLSLLDIAGRIYDAGVP